MAIKERQPHIKLFETCSIDRTMFDVTSELLNTLSNKGYIAVKYDIDDEFIHQEKNQDPRSFGTIVTAWCMAIYVGKRKCKEYSYNDQ